MPELIAEARAKAKEVVKKDPKLANKENDVTKALSSAVLDVK